MNVASENISITLPKTDVLYLRNLAKEKGWEITDRETTIRNYFASRPKESPLTEEDILQEVMNVRYGK